MLDYKHMEFVGVKDIQDSRTYVFIKMPSQDSPKLSTLGQELKYVPEKAFLQSLAQVEEGRAGLLARLHNHQDCDLHLRDMRQLRALNEQYRTMVHVLGQVSSAA